MRLKRFLKLLGVCLVLAYIAYCALMAWQVDDMLFPNHGRDRAAGRGAPAGFETHWLTLADGRGRVEGWWLPAAGASAKNPLPAVIYFHGNGELIDDNRDVAEVWHRLGVSVLLCEHRGYGRSDGAPTLRAITEDAGAWFDFVAGRPEVRADRIVSHGFSIGAAYAAQLAASRPVGGVVLESGFSSLPSMGRRYGVWIYFPRERLDSAAALRGLPDDVPVLITHGTDDAIIPVSEGRRLAQARPQAVYVEGDYPHFPQAQTEPDHALFRAFLTRLNTP